MRDEEREEGGKKQSHKDWEWVRGGEGREEGE